jgi:serine/threonine protein kinase
MLPWLPPLPSRRRAQTEAVAELESPAQKEMIGSSLNQYHIAAKLGVGGMGEVFRARDTRLNREVAIKILPKEFASDPDRLRRFEQETKTLASLNHPNILTIHDVGMYEPCDNGNRLQPRPGICHGAGFHQRGLCLRWGLAARCRVSSETLTSWPIRK